jgi:signal transduction histidine kinase
LNTIVNIIFADRENNVWLANEPGVIKVTNQSVKTFYFDELAPGGSNVMQESDSVIWVTNSKFLYRISGNLFSKVPEFRFNNEGYISTINKDLHGNLWITYWDGGVSKMKWNGHRLVTLKSFKKAISGQLMMTGDTVWVIGTKGIFLIRNNVVIHHFHPNNRNGTPATISCFAMDEQQRQLWIGDNAEGIIKIDFADSSGRFTYSASEYITSENGLKDMAVRSLMLDKDKRLWIGTRFGGIYHLTKKGSSKSLVEDVTIKANMECTRTTQIAEEKGRAVWFATCNGIYRYINNGQQWEQYNTGIGLVNAEIFSIAVNEKNKRLWAAGAEGVSELKIGEKIQAIPPVVSLIDITILGKSDTSALFSKASMKYQSNQSSIGFVFAGASFIDEKQIKYKYMLQGYDKSWSEPVMTNNVNYASLPPGKYVFKVLAANVQNQWSSSPAMFQFEIVLPFYKRPWFIFALLLVSILVAYFIRVQQLKQRFNIEKLRLAIARDLHDDVGSTLGSINLLSKTATRRLDKNFSPDEIAPIFEKIGQSAEDTLEAMDDIVWSINPDKDKVEDLVIRMREFAIPLFESNNIEFNFVFDADNHKPLPMNLRRNAFLVFKEAIHNIIKHANASLITVRIRAEHDKFLMKISDNGKGFLANFSSPRNGIKNMHNRAKICHADLQISSSPAGTTINFVAPIV